MSYEGIWARGSSFFGRQTCWETPSVVLQEELGGSNGLHKTETEGKRPSPSNSNSTIWINPGTFPLDVFLKGKSGKNQQDKGNSWGEGEEIVPKMGIQSPLHACQISVTLRKTTKSFFILKIEIMTAPLDSFALPGQSGYVQLKTPWALRK